MNAYPMLIYGGGNCEISAKLQQEMQQVCRLDLSQQKIYARTHLLANSCLAMYKRFHGLREKVDSTKLEGVYEYICMGEEEGIERQELKMSRSSDTIDFRDFLEQGLDILKEKEVQLILIGQSFKDGLFLDIYDMPPSYLPYEDLFKILEEITVKKKINIHLILDIPICHYVELPYRIIQNTYIKSLLIWEREDIFELFPVAEWVKASDDQDISKIEEIKKRGWDIQFNQVDWERCHDRWQEHMEVTSSVTLSLFKNTFKRMYVGFNKEGLWEKIYKLSLKEEKQNRKYRLSSKELKEYFRMLYEEEIALDIIEEWINEMKKCISYYKM